MTTIAGWCAILAIRPGAPGVTRLVAALEERGVPTVASHPAGVPGPRAPDPPDLAVCRLVSGCPQPVLTGLIEHEREGLSFLNRPSVVRAVHDKPFVLARLAEAGIAVPPTVCIARGDVASLDALEGEVFVVKPVTGAAGRGVTMNLGRSEALAGAVAFADASGPVLVQPVLGDGIDRRLFVVAGRVVAAMERRPARPGARGSLHYGAQARNIDPSTTECDLATAVTDLFDLDIAGVDLLLHADRPLVLEVNACPGLEGIEAATGKDVAGRIAQEVVRRLGAR